MMSLFVAAAILALASSFAFSTSAFLAAFCSSLNVPSFVISSVSAAAAASIALFAASLAASNVPGV